MNQRQKQKHYKRKFRRSLAHLFLLEGIRIKPSRIKVTTILEGDDPRMVGTAAGYEIILHFKSKEE